MRTLSARRLEAALAAGDYSGARIMDAVVNRLNRTLQPAEGGNRSAAATVAAVPLLAVGTLWGGRGRRGRSQGAPARCITPVSTIPSTLASSKPSNL